jgi:hypothetical protein
LLVNVKKFIGFGSECRRRAHRVTSDLLARLPDPSLSQGQVEAVPVTVARERGVFPEASNETLQAFSFSKMKKGCFSAGMERRTIAAKLRYVISDVNM